MQVYSYLALEGARLGKYDIAAEANRLIIDSDAGKANLSLKFMALTKRSEALLSLGDHAEASNAYWSARLTRAAAARPEEVAAFDAVLIDSARTSLSQRWTDLDDMLSGTAHLHELVCGPALAATAGAAPAIHSYLCQRVHGALVLLRHYGRFLPSGGMLVEINPLDGSPELLSCMLGVQSSDQRLLSRLAQLSCVDLPNGCSIRSSGIEVEILLWRLQSLLGCRSLHEYAQKASAMIAEARWTTDELRPERALSLLAWVLELLGHPDITADDKAMAATAADCVVKGMDPDVVEALRTGETSRAILAKFRETIASTGITVDATLADLMALLSPS